MSTEEILPSKRGISLREPRERGEKSNIWEGVTSSGLKGQVFSAKGSAEAYKGTSSDKGTLANEREKKQILRER